MIVVTGGNGQLGRMIVAELEKLIGPGFIVTVRDPAKAADLAARGITVRAGDFDKADEIAHAVEGGDTLLLMASNAAQDARLKQHGNAIDGAKKAGIGRIAFVGYLADQEDSPFASTPSILYTLDYARKAGYQPINLRNGNYAESGVIRARDAIAAGKLYLPTGEGKVSYVSRHDLARATARILADKGNEGKSYALTGPAAYSSHDLARVASKVAGRTIPYENPTPFDYKAALVASGAPAPRIDFQTRAAETIKRGLLSEVTDTIEELTGHAPEDGLDFIERELRK